MGELRLAQKNFPCINKCTKHAIYHKGYYTPCHECADLWKNILDNIQGLVDHWGDLGAIKVVTEIEKELKRRAAPVEKKVEHTGVSAMWCPICGNCTCTKPEDGLDDPDCPLHGDDSDHGD